MSPNVSYRLGRELREENVLQRLSTHHRLPIRDSLELPSAALLRTAGHDVRRYRQVCALPQVVEDHTAPYALVVANPELISIAEFQAQGVPIYLAKHEEIEEVWQKFESSDPLPAVKLSDNVREVMPLIEQLLADVRARGASEVFVGVNEIERYEFLVKGRRFWGRAHPSLYQELLRECCAVSPQKPRFEIEVGGGGYFVAS